MTYNVIATDYDGTLATHGRVSQPTIEAMERAKAAGIHLMLITGRTLEQVFRDFPRYDLFGTIIVEDGAVIYNPTTTKKTLLGPAPHPQFLQELRKRDIPFLTGEVVIATYDTYLQDIITIKNELDLDYQVNRNKDALMLLPTGIHKGTGLQAALKEINRSTENVVGFGDAENDHAFLSIVGCAVAVENALPPIKEIAHYVTKESRGAGVTEVINMLLANETIRAQ